MTESLARIERMNLATEFYASLCRSHPYIHTHTHTHTPIWATHTHAHTSCCQVYVCTSNYDSRWIKDHLPPAQLPHPLPPPITHHLLIDGAKGNLFLGQLANLVSTKCKYLYQRKRAKGSAGSTHTDDLLLPQWKEKNELNRLHSQKGLAPKGWHMEWKCIYI